MGVFALTGNLASGKSTVIDLLNRKGASSFDVDRRIHQYYQDKNCAVYKKVTAYFPETVALGEICRDKLREVVFSNPLKLKKLENIVHPQVTRELIEWIDKVKGKKNVYVAEVPLLFEKKLAHYFDKVIMVTAKRNILIKRVVKKYKISQSKAQSRLSLYMPIREKIKRSDFIVDNSLGLRSLKKEVDLLWRELK